MKQFGTFKGVFIPSNNAILGTVLFLLLPALTADVGLFSIVAIIILAHTVTVATAFSLADCATNLNRIGPGGMYALSKRSLGKSLGGSIGIQLYFAQAASIGFYCIGFAEPLQPILSSTFSEIAIFQNTDPESIMLQKQIMASIVLFVFTIIVMIGADFTLKIQSLIMVILFISAAIILFSPFLGLQYEGEQLFRREQIGMNLFGNREITLAVFFAAFAQFFPAVTGIDAGVGMSGDLKNPKKSLVKGTFAAISVTFVIYMVSSLVFASMKKDVLITRYEGMAPVGQMLTDILGLHEGFPENIFGGIVLLGIVFATTSSALSCLMTAPRTAQSLAKDSVLPGFLGFLRLDFIHRGLEPRFATLITFFVGLGIIWLGNINLAAMIVGLCFLSVYGWVNGSAFLERISGNPSFRPTSKGHWSISLYGFLTCLLTIILFDWLIGLMVILTQYVFFQLIFKNKSESRMEGVWWGVLFSFISKGLHSLDKIIQGSKNWRPFLTSIAFDGENNHPDKIARIAEVIASYKGMVVMNILIPEKEKTESTFEDSYSIPTNVIQSGDFTESALSIIQMVALGGIRQNSVLMEFSRKVDSVKVLKKALTLHSNVLLLKNGERFHGSKNIDIWWRGERNGNLMVLLAYIIKTSSKENEEDMNIRIIRKLDQDENPGDSREEMQLLLDNARLSGEVYILSNDDDKEHENKSFPETVREISKSAEIIMMGLPGDFLEDNKKRKIFSLNEYFFSKEIHKFDDMPPILFVKSAHVVSLNDN